MAWWSPQAVPDATTTARHPQRNSAPVRAYCPTVNLAAVDHGNGAVTEANVVQLPTDIHTVAAFELESHTVTLQTLIDGAEDDQTRLCRETGHWVRTGDNPSAGMRAYNADIDNTSVASISNLMTLSPFIITPSTVWQFHRAYAMIAVESIQYRY